MIVFIAIASTDTSTALIQDVTDLVVGTSHAGEQADCGEALATLLTCHTKASVLQFSGFSPNKVHAIRSMN